jgi:hypothetical protein
MAIAASLLPKMGDISAIGHVSHSSYSMEDAEDGEACVSTTSKVDRSSFISAVFLETKNMTSASLLEVIATRALRSSEVECVREGGRPTVVGTFIGDVSTLGGVEAVERLLVPVNVLVKASMMARHLAFRVERACTRLRVSGSLEVSRMVILAGWHHHGVGSSW